MRSSNARLFILTGFLLFTVSMVPRLLAQDTNASSAIDEWRSGTLRKIHQRLQSQNLPDLEQRELRARHAWLESWTPGQLSVQPFTQPENVRSAIPDRRPEPTLNSETSTTLQNKFSSIQENPEQEQYQLLRQHALEHANDAAVQQLFLRWMDDDNQRRKGYLAEIDEVTRRLARLLRRSLDDKTVANGQKQVNQLALEFVLYRRVRALAYRELPDVAERFPVQDAAKLDQEINDAYAELISVAGSGRAEFVLIEIRILRRRGQYGLALQMLERFGHTVSPKWYLKKRRDLLQHLNWQPPCQEAAAIYAAAFPEEVERERQRNQ